MIRIARQFGLRIARGGRIVPNPPRPRSARQRRAAISFARLPESAGFTLIEVLAVVGIIALIAAGIGLSLRDTGGSSLTSAQNAIATLVGQTRAQAAVNQTEARLLIYGTRPPSGDAEKFLRLVRVVVAETPGLASTRWLSVGPPVYLPRGVFVVPNPTTGLIASGVAWPTNPAPVSTLLNVQRYTIVNDVPGADTYYAIEYRPDGTLNTTLGNQPYAKIAIGTGALANNLPQFNNAGAVRGFIFRPTGALSFVNDAPSF